MFRTLISVFAVLCALAGTAFATALSITAANVSYVSGPVSHGQVAGEAFAAGAILYYKPDTNTWLKAQCDGTAAEAGADGLGMALGTADAAGAVVSIARPGAVVAIGTGTAATVYMPGTTAGSLVPMADAAQTNKVTPAALGIGTNRLLLMWAYASTSVVP